MQSLRIKRYLLILLMPVVLVLIGETVILHRGDNAPERVGSLTIDTVQYVKIIEGRFDDAMLPYRYRILVPSIARLLPFSPPAALKLITYVALYFCYLIGLLILMKMSFSMGSSVAAMLAVFAIPLHLLNYSNPYLTDGLGMMVLFLMIWCLLYNRFWSFLAVGGAGILVREATLFLVPAWLIRKQYLKALLAIIIGLLAYAIPRYLLRSPNYSPDAQSWNAERMLWVLRSWFSFGIMGFLGLLLIRKLWFSRVAWVFGLLLTGAFLAGTYADIFRMFSILTPVMLILLAAFFYSLQRKHAFLGISILIFLLLGDFLLVPNLLLYDDRTLWGIDRKHCAAAIKAIEILLVLFATYRLRSEIKSGFAEKITIVTGTFRRREKDEGVKGFAGSRRS